MDFLNIYNSCSCNPYHHCMDVQDNWIIFGTNNSIAIYDIESRRIIALFPGHSDQINSIRWIENGIRYFVSSSADKTTIIWSKTEVNTTYYEQKFKLGPQTDSVIVSDTIFKNDDRNFITITATNDKSIHIWRNDEIMATENFRHFVFDIRIYEDLEIFHGVMVLTAGSNDAIRIHRLDDCKLEHLTTLEGHSDWIKSIDLIQDQNRIMVASASQDFFVRAYEIKCYDSETEVKQSQTFVSEGQRYTVALDTVLAGHEAWVTGVKWLHMDDTLHLLTCSMDKMIILWEQMDESIWTEKTRLGELGGNSIGFLNCCFMKPDKIVGLSFYGAIQIWKRNEDGDWITCPPITGHFKEVTDLVWEPKGEYFLTCSADQTTRLHSPWIQDDEKLGTWHEIARPQIHGYDIKCLSMAGRLKFVSGADEKVIRVFNATKNFVESIGMIGHIWIEPEDQDMAEYATVPSLGLSNSAIYDVSNTEEDFKPVWIEEPPGEDVLLQSTLWPECQKLYGHGYEIFALSVNHKGTLLASACKASTPNHASIILWDLKTYKKLANLSSHSLTVTQLKFSPDDSWLLSVSRDRTWALFEMKSDQYERVAFSDKKTGIHTRIIWDCAWTPDSRCFLTASRDKTVIVWNLNDELDLKGDSKAIEVRPLGTPFTFEHPVTAIDVHKNLVAIGLENGAVMLYSLSIDPFEWNLLTDFKGHWHTSTVNRIRFSPKNDSALYLASCSSDRSVRLFFILPNTRQN